MNVKLVNGDPFGNHFRVTDTNDGDALIFNAFIEAHGERWIVCRANDSGFGSIITYQDDNPGIGRTWLREGEPIPL
jgi:hypothetical protein